MTLSQLQSARLEKTTREFRAIPSQIQAIENNLSEANMGFEEFAEAVAKGGVFRGFSDEGESQ